MKKKNLMMRLSDEVIDGIKMSMRELGYLNYEDYMRSLLDMNPLRRDIKIRPRETEVRRAGRPRRYGIEHMKVGETCIEFKEPDRDYRSFYKKIQNAINYYQRKTGNFYSMIPSKDKMSIIRRA